MGRKSKYIVIGLLICFVILFIKYIDAQEQRRSLEQSIDYAYQRQLNNVLTSFSSKVNDYTYRSMVSSVYSVSQMSELTSYEKINDDIDISLHYLYISLREEKSKDKILARTDELRDIFFIMVKDPTSEEATNRLIQIANETYFKVPD